MYKNGIKYNTSSLDVIKELAKYYEDHKRIKAAVQLYLIYLSANYDLDRPSMVKNYQVSLAEKISAILNIARLVISYEVNSNYEIANQCLDRAIQIIYDLDGRNPGQNSKGNLNIGFIRNYYLWAGSVFFYKVMIIIHNHDFSHKP